MNKICTTIKQSKKLIELGIDISTADMYYMYRTWEIDENTIGAQSDAHLGFDSDFYYGKDNGADYHYIPAWSLSALMDLMPERITSEKLSIGFSFDYNLNGIFFVRNNPLDAAFEMVRWLKANGKL